MRQCIFCKKIKHESEFNDEHIILEGLGGKGVENMSNNVCITCNSSLGTRVDALLLDHVITQYQRFTYKIKGKNRIPNPFKKIDINYDNTFIKGNLKIDKDGEICGFRAKYSTYEKDGKVICVGPRKDAEKYAKSQMKKMGYSELTKLDLGTPKVPSIEYVEFPPDVREEYLYHSFPAMLKMAYEFCVKILGNSYLEDECAENIRQYLFNFDKKQENIIPTNATLEWGNEINNKVSIELFQTDDKKIYVNLMILGYGLATICMSEDASRYGKVEKSTLSIWV